MDDQFFGLTDTGKERENNEDTFIAQRHANNRFIIAGVIDGVGGYSGGEIAALFAKEAILQRLEKPSEEIIPMLIDCFNQANEKILTEKIQVKEHNSMACVATLALADIENNQFYYVHVGDTRLYLLRDGSLVKISHDQSFVGYLEDSGRIDEQTAMTHPKRNEINKALGFEAMLTHDVDYAETGQSPFLPGDIILLCSDGLTDMVGKAEITTIITKNNSLKDKCQELINTANNHGGRDNITVVLVQNNKQSLIHDVTMPVAITKKKDEKAGPTTTEQVQDKPITLQPAPVGKKTTGLITMLTILMLIFLVTSIWLYVQQTNEKNTLPPKAVFKVAKKRNSQEIKLQNAIDHAKGYIVIIEDTAYKMPILISRAIQVNKDSLLLKANGKVELKSDPDYKGAAFNLAARCKSMVLDSLVINNFNIGVLAFNTSLSLKNMRFINCMAALENVFVIPDQKYINGKVTAVRFKDDSLPVTGKRKVWNKK
ncbi:MAG: stp [Mucilaginibacter sp.]|nr:stp [Mucilaginibacter sp.]